MIRLFLCSILFSLLLVSCADQSSRPTGVLSAEKMEAVLWDLLRAEQFVSNYVVGRDSSLSAKAKGPQLYAAILSKHGLTDSLFRVSLDFYKKHPKQLQPIMDSIGQRPISAPTPLATLLETAVDSVTAPAAKSTPPSTPSIPADKRPNFSPKPLAY